MHSPIAFLTDLALVLGIAAVTSVLSQRLRLPPVFGYLVSLVAVTLPFLPGYGRPGFTAAGRRLSELNLRGVTGASVVGLRRGEDRIVLPSAREQLREGDILAVTGNQRAVAAATAVLQGAESAALHKYHDATER